MSAPPAIFARQRSPLAELLFLAAPTVATMTSYTLMQFVDKLMVSRIGPDPIYVGAQGNGGLAAWVPIAIMMGFVTVINTYVSQHLGAGKPERGPAYAWAGLWMVAAYWLVVMIPFGLLLPSIFDLMHSVGGVSPNASASAIDAVRRDDLAASYGRILIYGSIITMAARAISHYFYGLHRPGIILIAGLAGNLVNIVFNSLLIYGPQAPRETGIAAFDAWFAFTASLCQSWGWSARGIDGAAYATVIGTAVELMIPMAVFLSPRSVRTLGTLRQWRPSLPHMRELFTIGWPGALMFGNEMLCWAFFMVYLVGEFGPMHSTAGWIAHQWMTLSFMPAVGLSVAITSSVGKCMGMKRPDMAARRAWLGLGISVGYMTLCGLMFVLFRHQLVGLFVEPGTSASDTELIIKWGSRFLIAAAAFQFFDGIAMSLSGALRGAGDTIYTGVATLVISWSILVAGGLAIVRFAPGLESLGPWIMAATYIIALAIMFLLRFLGGKWKTMKLVEDPSRPEGSGRPATPAQIAGSSPGPGAVASSELPASPD